MMAKQFTFVVFVPAIHIRKCMIAVAYGFCRVDEVQHPKKIPEEPDWACYPRGALYALQSKGHHLTKVENITYTLLIVLNLYYYVYSTTVTFSVCIFGLRLRHFRSFLCSIYVYPRYISCI